jgi:MBG domain
MIRATMAVLLTVGLCLPTSVAASADDATGAIHVDPQSQTITFDPLGDKTYGDAPFDITASSTSGLDVDFAVGGTDQCTILGTTVTITGAGSCSVTVSQAGDEKYLAADPVTRTFTINKATATLALTDLTYVYDGSPKSATVTTNPNGISGVSITYDGSPTASTNAGTYAVIATLANDNYSADPANDHLVIAKADQTITFSAISDRIFGDAPFGVLAPATSGLVVSFAPTGVCTMSASTVTITHAGKCSIVASQGGDTNHNPATPVTRTFIVVRASPTVSVEAISLSGNPNPQFSDSITLRASLGTSLGSSQPGGRFVGTVVFSIKGSNLGNVSVPVDVVGATTVSTNVHLGASVLPLGVGPKAYPLLATYLPAAGSDYRTPVVGSGHLVVLPEGVTNIGLDGSTAFVYAGPTTARYGSAPKLSFTLAQSRGLEAADHEYVDFTGGVVKVVIRLYRLDCGNPFCSTDPVFTSAVLTVKNATTWATTGDGIAFVNAASGVHRGAYRVGITELLPNVYIRGGSGSVTSITHFNPYICVASGSGNIVVY